MSTLPRVISVFVLVLIFSSCGPKYRYLETPLFKPFDHMSNSAGPHALTYDGRDLIVGNRNQILYLRLDTDEYFKEREHKAEVISYSTAQQSFTFFTKIQICGMAWEGECCEHGFLWVADSFNNMLVKYDMDYKIVRAIPSPAKKPNGLTFDGKDLWVACSEDRRIYRISPTPDNPNTLDGATLLSAYDTVIKQPLGLAWDCEGIWIVGLDTCKTSLQNCYAPRLVKMNPADGAITHEIALPAEIERPTSVTWINGKLYVGDYLLNRVYEFDVATWQKPVTPPAGADTAVASEALPATTVMPGTYDTGAGPALAPLPVEESPLNDSAAVSAQAPQQDEWRRFADESIYFAFDSAVLSPAAQSDLTWKAGVMQRHPDMRIVIQGNCDNRGTVEYNLALGEQRAQAAKSFLVDQGVDAARIRTLSFGEENPVDSGQNETAWAKNRRDDFVIE